VKSHDEISEYSGGIILAGSLTAPGAEHPSIFSDPREIRFIRTIRVHIFAVHP
jgi:hypothetical protein